MLNLQEIRELQKHKGEALVSIIAPMEKAWPASDKNPLIIKNLIKATEKKLHGNYDPARVEALMEKVKQLEARIDYNHTAEGIALFISEKMAQTVPLTFMPKEKVYVSNTFQTRDLLKGYQEDPDYLLLSISKGDVRLFRGHGRSMEEVKNENFPASYGNPERSEPVKRTLRTDVEYEILEDMKSFLRKVDDNLCKIVNTSQEPVFIAGEEEYLAYMKKSGACSKYIKGLLHENLAHMSMQDITAHLLPHILQFREGELQRLKEELIESKGSGRYAGGLQDVWKATKMGQVLSLFVDDSYSCPARVKTANEMELILGEDDSPLKANYHEDIVDDIIELVSQSGGEVFFLHDGGVPGDKKIAAILRYSI